MNLLRRSGVPLEPLHSNHPVGIEATDPDHITITPLGKALVRLLDTKAVVATCVLLTPLAAVGAVATPVSVDVPLIDKLPPETLPVAVSAPAVVIVPVAEITPEVNRLPPVTLPVAEINPVVRKLPPCTLPVTDNDPKVPTVVMPGWLGVLSVPVSVTDVTCVAVMVPTVNTLLTVRSANDPISVMLGWLAVCSVPLMMLAVIVPLVIVPEQSSVVTVPRDVILGCEAAVTVAAATASGGTRFSR